jgi:DNA-binding MarR family transcriptional regulator
MIEKAGDDMATSVKTASKRVGGREEERAVRVLRRFRIVFNAVRTHFRSMESTAGVSGAQVWALSEVATNPGMGVNQLARAMDIHQSTASNLVRALLDAGLVVSEKGETDRRAVHLHATARGVRTLGKAPPPFTGLLPDALERLDDPTLARMERDLDKLIRELQADPELAQIPLWANE